MSKTWGPDYNRTDAESRAAVVYPTRTGEYTAELEAENAELEAENAELIAELQDQHLAVHEHVRALIERFPEATLGGDEHE